ncbi:MAG: glycosyltransferase [Patescibacteria group bacterium]|nr:glycosyltransferase [Patescibacteria group bacterium]
MKVALVHDFLHNMGGAERVLLALAELFPDAPIYTLVFDPKLKPFFDPKRIHTSYLQKWRRIPSRFFIGLAPQAVESFDFTSFDVVISSSNSFVKNIITKPETLHISYVHSPMRYAWDEAHTQLKGQAYRTPLGSVFGLVELIAGDIISKLRVWDRLGVSRVDIFVANAQNVRRRIQKYYRRDAHVIYPPVDTHLIQHSDIRGDYYLVLSRLSRYKRIDLAVSACRELDLPLVVIGAGEMEAQLQKMAGPHTKFLGFVDDVTRIKYLQNCKGLIFPGEEDFGIVPVEAMAAGKPVLAFRKGGLLESVIEGRTGAFFDEQSIASITEALKDFDKNVDNFDSQVIHEHALTFSKAAFKDNIEKLVKEKLHATTQNR